MFNVLWESIGEENEFSYAAIFDGKFGKKSERVITDLRRRTADALVLNLESVELASEGSDLNTLRTISCPTARCTQDTKKRQLVTRSSLQKLRCCVCHLHQEQAMKTPYRVKQFFGVQILKKVEQYRVDVITEETALSCSRFLYF